MTAFEKSYKKFIEAKMTAKQAEQRPGPGAYNDHLPKGYSATKNRPQSALIKDIRDVRFKSSANGNPSPDKYKVAEQSYNMSTKLSPNKGNKIPENRKGSAHRPNWNAAESISNAQP